MSLMVGYAHWRGVSHGYRAFDSPSNTLFHIKFLIVRREQYITRSEQRGNHLSDADRELPIANLTERRLSLVLVATYAQESQRGT